MSFEIYHQLGHQYKWNLDSITQDNTGDGVILSPRHMTANDIIKLDATVRTRSIFDPQFYLPSFAKGQLQTYSFFPANISSREQFSTDEYIGGDAYASAMKCVEFQRVNRFRYIVIPTRYKEGMPSNYIDDQQSMFVDPFSIMLKDNNYGNVLLQIVLTEHMLKDWNYMSDLLNWITGIDGICGVYSIISKDWNEKLPTNIDMLLNYMKFIDVLRRNELQVILGYLNLESIILTIASPNIVTMGTYETTKMFQINRFTDEESNARGPVPRIFIPPLLQNIDRRYLGTVSTSLPSELNLYGDDRYQVEFFKPTYNWHFQKPEPYKHNLIQLSKLLRQIGNRTGKDRYEYLVQIINDATALYNILDSEGVALDKDSSGEHLSFWLTTINKYANIKGWR